MKGLIQASLGNPYAVIVMALTVFILGSLALLQIPVDILPVFKSPAVQVLTFYGGMPAKDVEKALSIRMENTGLLARCRTNTAANRRKRVFFFNTLQGQAGLALSQ